MSNQFNYFCSEMLLGAQLAGSEKERGKIANCFVIASGELLFSN